MRGVGQRVAIDDWTLTSSSDPTVLWLRVLVRLGQSIPAVAWHGIVETS